MAEQYQKRRLKRILRIVVTQHAPADTPDHRPMPPHQRSDGRLIALFDEPAQEPAIGERSVIVSEDGAAQMFNNAADSAWHRTPLAVGGRFRALYPYITRSLPIGCADCPRR